MFARLAPATNAYSNDRNEEILYLKWDLLRFLEPGDARLLTHKVKTEIARLAACLATFRNMPDNSIDIKMGLELLSNTTNLVQQAVEELNRQDLSGEHRPTPREKLLKGELAQLIARIAHMTSLFQSLRDTPLSEGGQS